MCQVWFYFFMFPAPTHKGAPNGRRPSARMDNELFSSGELTHISFFANTS